MKKTKKILKITVVFLLINLFFTSIISAETVYDSGTSYWHDRNGDGYCDYKDGYAGVEDMFDIYDENFDHVADEQWMDYDLDGIYDSALFDEDFDGFYDIKMDFCTGEVKDLVDCGWPCQKMYKMPIRALPLNVASISGPRMLSIDKIDDNEYFNGDILLDGITNYEGFKV